jgi:hypothetical protein
MFGEQEPFCSIGQRDTSSHTNSRRTVEEPGRKSKRMIVEVQCVRLTSEEQSTWEQETKAKRAAQKRETERPSTIDEVSTLVKELAADTNVSSWLSRIDRKPINNLSAEVIEAVIPLLNNRKVSYSSIAKRIIDRVPDEKLNPLELLDPPPEDNSK